MVANAIESRDTNAAGHSERVAKIAVRLGKELGVSGAGEIEMLRFGSLLHDVGKVAVPEAIMRKPGMLLDYEWECVRRHPAVGYELCMPMRHAGSALAIIRHHHERLNGSGYPDGLRGEDIPLPVRIVAVADITDALLSRRSYRDAYPINRVVEILHGEAREGLLDMRVVEALIEAVIPKLGDLFGEAQEKLHRLS
jgi:putative two-component system response regulator